MQPAGAKVAPHTRVATLVRKTLIVEVDDFTLQRSLAGLAHFIISNLARETGEVLVDAIDFRPMQARRGPARAASHGATHGSTADAPASGEESGIGDFFLRMQYAKSKKKASA